MMAIGDGRGEHKAVDAVRRALSMPLLDFRSIEAACGVLLHFTGGDDLSLHEINQAAGEVNRAAPEADVIFGAAVNPLMKGRAQVILIATGVGAQPPKTPAAAAAPTAVQHPATVMPNPVVSEEPLPHLAEALFSRAAASATDPLAQPWVVADTPTAHDVRHSLDVPAFLRRSRHSLRDFEGRS